MWQRHAGCAGARQAAFRDMLCAIRRATALSTPPLGTCLDQVHILGEPCEALYEFWWFTPGIFLVMVALK
jgi:hypothetical protein